MDKTELFNDAEGMDVVGPTTPVPLDLGDVILKLHPGDGVPPPDGVTTGTSGVSERPSTSGWSETEPYILGLGSDQETNPRFSVGTSGMVTPGTAFPPFDPRFSFTSTLGTIEDYNLPIDKDRKKRVVVLGSGDFGLALITRLVHANYSVVVASRNPNRTRERVTAAGGIIMTQAEALQQSNLVILAIPFPHVSSLPLSALRSKILIDVSNRDPKTYNSTERSQAEHLQALVPSATVVKAFNVLSAYSLSKGIRGSKEVPVCSDDNLARLLVCGIVKDLGLEPLDRGSLRNAREVEGIPFIFFREWKFAFIVSIIIWFIAFFIILFEWQLCNNLRNLHKPNGTFDWSSFDNVAKSNLSISCSSTAITLLAICYLPGVIAAYVQLARGTKYSEFPRWLNRWLKARKQLGLLMLFNAFIHVLCQLSDSGGYGLGHSSYNWRRPTFIACGILAFTMAGVLGLASLPSVGTSMTWREFSFLQSRLGWFTLLLAAFHIIFNVWDGLVTPNFTCYIPSISQFVIVMPVLTLVLKLPLLLPCVDNALTRIRQGFERIPTPPSV
ncbi:metalloreductase STEAP4-like isoform X2 [Homarus americanus]|nr:metalloreductase STEAP4-like isoform X2 [Homarus americanus]